MFGVPGAEMPFFTSDRTGSAHEPHPDAPARDKDTRVSYLMLKTVADHLSGPGLAATAVRFQGAMGGQIGAIVMGEEWIEMDDLFVFVRGLVARATCETMLGSKFLAQFPDFVDSFYTYNDRIRRFLQGWPRFLIPRAWAARKRCTEIMRLWKRGVEADGESFDGSPMMVKRWAWFEKWGISEDAIAASDLGILWGYVPSSDFNLLWSGGTCTDFWCFRTFSNAIILTFWLCWHALQDGELLAAATAEVEECRKEDSSLDTAKLMSQPLLQSMHAEALRKYVAVYIPRTTEYGATQILDYEIPKNKLLVINSGMAHMDERNWNLGPQNQYPVTKFWGERFLTPDTAEGSDQADKTLGTRNGKPKFSLSKYKGAWVPFGGGIHQCPARHWVKTQMLVSLAMIIGSFDIELLDGGKELEVGLAKYGLGALNPGEKAPFRIRRKRRSS